MDLETIARELVNAYSVASRCAIYEGSSDIGADIARLDRRVAEYERAIILAVLTGSKEEETCSECGNDLLADAGEGYDGRCGNCADKQIGG